MKWKFIVMNYLWVLFCGDWIGSLWTYAQSSSCTLICGFVVAGRCMELLLLFIGGLLTNLTLRTGYRVPDGRMLVTSWEG
jgi:hypothetical protein